MTPAIYNGCTLVGVASLGVGVHLVFGLGMALIVVGAVVLALTQAALRVGRG